MSCSSPPLSPTSRGLARSWRGGGGRLDLGYPSPPLSPQTRDQARGWWGGITTERAAAIDEYSLTQTISAPSHHHPISPPSHHSPPHLCTYMTMPRCHRQTRGFPLERFSPRGGGRSSHPLNRVILHLFDRKSSARLWHPPNLAFVLGRIPHEACRRHSVRSAALVAVRASKQRVVERCPSALPNPHRSCSPRPSPRPCTPSTSVDLGPCVGTAGPAPPPAPLLRRSQS